MSFLGRPDSSESLSKGYPSSREAEYQQNRAGDLPQARESGLGMFLRYKTAPLHGHEGERLIVVYLSWISIPLGLLAFPSTEVEGDY